MPMGMTDIGHIVHAQSMFDRVFHLAWGTLPADYPAPWGLDDVPPIPQSLVVTKTLTKGNPGTADQLPDVGILDVVSVAKGATVYTAGTDYVLNGRSIDWSPGGNEPAKNDTYTVIYRYNTTAIAALVQELGRREPTILAFANPAENGDIVANDISWEISKVPTRHIYLQFKFDSTDAVGQIIYQLGLFIGTTRQASVPVGKKHLLPSEVQDAGSLYMLENLSPFSRYAGKREIFEYVVTY